MPYLETDVNTISFCIAYVAPSLVPARLFESAHPGGTVGLHRRGQGERKVTGSVGRNSNLQESGRVLGNGENGYCTLV